MIETVLRPKGILLFFAMSGVVCAEVHSLTLRQALELTVRQNPDVALARLDQERQIAGVQVALDPFRPKVYMGSGLAYTYGYPNSIEGSAPSLFQLRTDMALYNRPKSFQVASAREAVRTAQLEAQAKADEVAYQAADLFLSASQVEHESETLGNQIPILRRVVATMSAAVNEGSELPLELKRARVNLSMSEQRLDAARLDADYYEMELAIIVGFPATDRVKPVDSEALDIAVPENENEAADAAIRSNRQLREMQSNIFAKEMELKSYRSYRYPQVDLVAQYALFAKYNYANYFQKFQRNNFQIGASITIPLFIGSAAGGLAAQAYADVQKLRIQMNETRNRILADTRRNYDTWKKAETIRNLSRMQLDLAREELSVLLAQNQEGRVPMSRVEQARVEEGNRWMAFYDSDLQALRAKLAVLKEGGDLLAVVRGTGGGSNAPQ